LLQVAAVEHELLQLRADAAAAGRERRQLFSQVVDLEKLKTEHVAALTGLQQQLQEVKSD
jgi:hypothetical protein